MTPLAMHYGARWTFFMHEAAVSLELSRTAPTRILRRLWLDQANSELERAKEAQLNGTD